MTVMTLIAIATNARLRYMPMDMPLTLNDLQVSPDHYLHSFDGDDAIFVPMDRAAYHRSIFLDGRISVAKGGSMRMPVSALVGGKRSISWIFHIAHCGSTLLARALDRPSLNLVLREPVALRQVAVTPDVNKLNIVLAMLGKRYDSTTPTVVKANVPVNFILSQIVDTDIDARAVFLYCPLRDYLLAVLRSEGHRHWVRQVTDQFAPQLGTMAGLPDAQRAAALWLAQMSAFAEALRRMPNARSLDAEAFFGNPMPILGEIAAHLQVMISRDDVAQIVADPLFSTSAKNPALAFDNSQRLARRAELEASIRGELDQAQSWVEYAGGGMRLDSPIG
jgi:hypothetical protein